MAAEVTPLQPLKIAAGPDPTTPEQRYWKSFKSQLLVPSPQTNPITHISYPTLFNTSSASETFAVTSGSRVQIFSSRSRKLLKTVTRFGYDDAAHSGEIRRDGRLLLAGGDSGAIQAFDVNSRAILKTWKEHKQPVWVTKWSPTELTTLMSASDDKTVRLWDLPSEKSTAVFVGHQDYVRSGGFMPGQSSGLLYSGSYDQTVRLWDPRTPDRAIMTFKHAAAVESVLPTPSGTTLLASADNQISVLDLVAAKPTHILTNHQKTVTSLCLASNGTRLVSGGLDGHVKIFETTGWNVVVGSKYPSPVLSLSVVSSGPSDGDREDRHLVVGMQSGLLSIKTRLSGQQKVQERERRKEMEALVAGTIEEYDRKQRKQRKKGKGALKSVRGKDFTGEGADIVISGSGRRAKKESPSDAALRKGHYDRALDSALSSQNPVTVLTILTALVHRSALRAALKDRDEVTLQPILKWLIKYIADPRHVRLTTEMGVMVLDLYAEQMGRSKVIDSLIGVLHGKVRYQVERAQQAWQTMGMMDLLLAGS